MSPCSGPQLDLVEVGGGGGGVAGAAAVEVGALQGRGGLFMLARDAEASARRPLPPADAPPGAVARVPPEAPLPAAAPQKGTARRAGRRSRAAVCLPRAAAFVVIRKTIPRTAAHGPDCRQHNPGAIAVQTIDALVERGVALPSSHRIPRDVSEADIRGAALTIALKEAEHRAVVERRFPHLIERVEFGTCTT